MDPFHAGVHCSKQTCGRLDFLPFTCELCKETFCKEHAGADNHDCPHLTGKHDVREEKVEGGGSPLTIVCSVTKCGRKERVEVTCPQCDRRLCLVHPEDHDCPSLPTTATRPAPPVRKMQPFTASPRARVGAKSGSLSAKVALMKLKQQADGPHHIPQSERLYFTVSLPAGCGVKSAPLFFSKEWAVGKAVDSVARKYNISGHGDVSDSKKLMLFAPDGTVLLPSRTLNSYLELLPSGSSIAIDYG